VLLIFPVGVVPPILTKFLNGIIKTY
jgi:hypothetical protein